MHFIGGVGDAGEITGGVGDAKTNDPEEFRCLNVCWLYLGSLCALPNFILFAQGRLPEVGQWWHISVDAFDPAVRNEEEYFAEILAVHCGGKVDLQDLEENAGPEFGCPFNRYF